MNQNTDIAHEAKKYRLLAAALELQHFTSAAAHVVPIPGGDQVIAIGTPAQVADDTGADIRAGQQAGEAAGDELRAEINIMSQLLDDCEWAEHIAKTRHGQYIETAITRLVGQNADLRAQLASAQKDQDRLEFLMERGAWIAWGKDGERCRVFHRDEEHDDAPIMGWSHPNAWHDDAREAIDAARAQITNPTGN